MFIKIELAHDYLFGSEYSDGWDAEASQEEFIDRVRQELCKEFPNAEIEIEAGVEGRISVSDAGDPERAKHDVEHITLSVWSDFEWVILSQEGITETLNRGCRLRAATHGGDTILWADTRNHDKPRLAWCRGGLPPHYTESFDDLEGLLSRMEEVSSIWSVHGDWRI
jgi:hypothetical protein